MPRASFVLWRLKRLYVNLTPTTLAALNACNSCLSDLDTSLLDERDQQGAYGAPIRGGR